MALAALFGDLFIQLDYFSSLAWAFQASASAFRSSGIDPAWGPSPNWAVGPCWEGIPAGAWRLPILCHPSTPCSSPPSPPVSEFPLGDEGAQLGDVTRNAQGPGQGPEGTEIRCHWEPLDGPFHHLPQGQSGLMGT